MIVDPNTGLPIDAVAPGAAPQSMVGQVGQSLIGDQTSAMYNAMAYIPGATTMMAFNMGRGINTIMGGRWTDPGMLGRASNRNNVRSRLVNTFSPTRMFRFQDPRATLGYGQFGDSANFYSPFDIASRVGNWAGRRVASSAVAGSAQNMIDMTDTNIAWKTMRRLGLNEGQIRDVASGSGTRLFDGGVLSRMGAGSRLAYMGETSSMGRGDRRRLAKSFRALDRMGSDLSGIRGASNVARAGSTREAMRMIKAGRLAPNAAQFAAGRMATTGEGLLSGRLMAWKAGLELDTQYMRKTGKHYDTFIKSRSNFLSGALDVADTTTDFARAVSGGGNAKFAARALSRGKMATAGRFAARGAFKFGSRALPGIGTALLAYDALNIIGSGIHAMNEFTTDAIASRRGQIDKQIFGMGYRDTQINATSRARGMTAIQQSRLNSRNALGNEARAMFSHFG